MIYISAQPDSYYFLWQLKLQLFNFSCIEIPQEQIHVLIGYDPQKGLSSYFKDFIATNTQAHFYTYADTRLHKSYPSSIRPHLLKKHLSEYPHLQHECLFYHDSDILFHSLPQLSSLEEDSIWYASDTRSYLNYDYIIQNANETIFQGMCEIIGIPPKTVIQNNDNAGGAQYILKGTSFDFWNKVENDCEKLYAFLTKNIVKSGIFRKGENKLYSLDFWVTDMWVLWWNAMLYGADFRLSPKLDFCWATSAIEQWGHCNILHYTGSEDITNKSLFIKTKYKFTSPFYDDFSSISLSSCSSIVIDWIKAYKHNEDKKRKKITDFVFVIHLIKEKQTFENIAMLYQYIKKHLDIDIVFAGANIPQPNQPPFFNDCVFYECKDTDLIQNLQECTNKPYAIIYPDNIILPIENLVTAINLIKEQNGSILIFYGNNKRLDILTKYIFNKLLDAEFLLQNQGKLRPAHITEDALSNVYILSLKRMDKNEISYECDYYSF